MSPDNVKSRPRSKTRSSSLSPTEKFYLTLAKVNEELMNPPRIPEMELYGKILRAAKAVGLDDVVIYPWDRNFTSAWFTNGCVRERQYLTSRMCYDLGKDIGYIVKDVHSGEFSPRSFEINSLLFSDNTYHDFHTALKNQGLEPTSHYTFGTVYNDIPDRPKKLKMASVYR